MTVGRCTASFQNSTRFNLMLEHIPLTICEVPSGLQVFDWTVGACAELVGIEVGVVSGVVNLEASGVEASDWRLRHEATYHEA